MKKYDICLFDLDGTLTDSEQGIKNSFAHAAKSFGINPAGVDISRFLGPPIRESARIILGRDDEDEIEALVAKYREYFVERGMFENEVYPGVIELLEALAQSGVILTVATSKVGIYAERILEHFDLAKYFRLIVGCEMNGERSTKFELITHTFKTLGIDGSRAVMIGDRRQDIEGAKSAGVDNVAAIWGYSTPGEFYATPPTFFAKTPADILQIILS